jgi:integrase
MEWDELDLDKSVWTIPPHKMKMRRPHDVPLSRQAVETIKSMLPFTEGKTFVFASHMSGKTVLSENSMNSALRRMGFSGTVHVAHGFRTTASTMLNESRQFDPDVIEAQLAHQDPKKVRRVYNRAEYWDERVRMMQWWADEIDRLRAASAG